MFLFITEQNDKLFVMIHIRNPLVLRPKDHGVFPPCVCISFWCKESRIGIVLLLICCPNSFWDNLVVLVLACEIHNSLTKTTFEDLNIAIAHVGSNRNDVLHGFDWLFRGKWYQDQVKISTTVLNDREDRCCLQF